MKLDTRPASDYPMPDLVQFLNHGFEGYLVPIHFDIPSFLTMLRKDGIDLTASRVLLMEGNPSGLALIARRGWNSRLAAMGIFREFRNKNAGSWLMGQLVREARVRGDHEIMLEVIEQNDPGVHLYKAHGFKTIRRLIGFTHQNPNKDAKSGLSQMDLRELGRLISLHGLPDLPWQLSGETIACLNPPARAYKHGEAYIAVSNPETEHVMIWSLLVEPQSRGKGLAVELLVNLMANHPGRTWHVPAIFPEELGIVFERAGFQREELSQWQMRLDL